MKLLFVSLNQISAVYVAVQSRSQQGLKKSGKTAADVPQNTEHASDSRELKANYVKESDNVTMDYKKNM